MPASRGRFLTLEGIDGAGKSTHVPWIRQHLEATGREVVATREPGGTPLGEALREMLKSAAMTPDCEALLMFAARREHLERVIRPALSRGAFVVCDRFTDATWAYQGGGHAVDGARIAELESWIVAATRPDLTILFDIPQHESRARLERAREGGRALDNFEREEAAFFERVRAAYLERARATPERIRVVDSTRPVAAVRADIAAHLDALIGSLR